MRKILIYELSCGDLFQLVEDGGSLYEFISLIDGEFRYQSCITGAFYTNYIILLSNTFVYII